MSNVSATSRAAVSFSTSKHEAQRIRLTAQLARESVRKRDYFAKDLTGCVLGAQEAFPPIVSAYYEPISERRADGTRGWMFEAANKH